MLRIISFLAVAFLSFLYAVGFIYDTGYLLEFGYDSIQLPASAQEYLVFGSVFVLTGLVKKFTVFFYGFGVIASGYKPVERALKNSKLSRYIDFESLPYIMTASILPILLLMVGPIISSGQTDAKQIKSIVGNQEITILKGKDQHTHTGAIIRNRNNMLLFYDHNSMQTILTPHSTVIKNVAIPTSDNSL